MGRNAKPCSWLASRRSRRRAPRDRSAKSVVTSSEAIDRFEAGHPKFGI